MSGTQTQQTYDCFFPKNTILANTKLLITCLVDGRDSFLPRLIWTFILHFHIWPNC